MIEVTGNLWTYPADYRVITTNGDVRKDGCAVMGRGCAKQATVINPSIAAELGRAILTGGNNVHFLFGVRIFSFPVKHHWHEPADPNLILRSVGEFKKLILPDLKYVMPRPGCGNGNLNWDQVKPLLVTLPDNVFVIDYEKLPDLPVKREYRKVFPK